VQITALCVAKTTCPAGVIVTIGQTPVSVMSFTVTHGKIAEINSISNPARLQCLNLDIPRP
jgi:hypothetical protein